MEKRFYWIYVTVFINIVAFGMIFPLLPLFAKSFGATSFQVGLLVAVFSLVQFLTSPLLGKASDRFGRKPIFLLSITITSFSLFMMGLSQNLPMLFFGMALQGLGSAGVLPSALAYVADIAKGDNRSKYISRVTGTFALGFMIGPSVGGFLASSSLSLPFFSATIVSLLNLVVIYIFLHETHHDRDTKLAIKEGLINPKSLMFAMKGEFGLLFFLLFAWAIYISNLSLSIPFFTFDKFSFDTVQNGIFYSLIGFTAAFTQWFGLPYIEKRLGDVKTIFYGLILLFIGQMVVSFSPNAIIFFFVFVISVVGSALMRPSTNALLSKRTKEGQGTTMGLAFSFESSGRIVGPILLGSSITYIGVSAPFFITAGIIILAAILFYKYEVSKLN